jgi:TonB family protein
MNAPDETYSAWPTRRLIACIVFILAAQFALLVCVSESKTASYKQAPARTKVSVLSTDQLDDTARELLDLRDPTLRALVSPRGFSSRAWMTIPQFSYQLQSRSLPARPLEPPIEEWTGDFDEFVQTNLVFETFLSEKLPPLLAEVRLPRPLVVPSTVLRVEGDLASRPILNQQELPTPAAPLPLLSNTVVRVLVNPEGIALSSTLLAGSGSPAADQEALRYAKSTRFAPKHETAADSGVPGEFDFGYLIFQWSSVKWIEHGQQKTTQ